MATCEHCCGADMLFDMKNAQKELKNYRKKGPRKVTKKLINLLQPYFRETSSLLDVGGGIGAIQWAYLESSEGSTTDVDASSAYLDVARSYALEKGWSDRTDYKMGDVVDLQLQMKRYDLVSMDKVVCCYPDYRAILELATEKCNCYLVLSFPMNGIVADLFRGLGVLYMKFKRNPFRPFIHSPRKMEALILSKGFEKVSQSHSFPWHLRLYKKI